MASRTAAWLSVTSPLFIRDTVPSLSFQIRTTTRVRLPLLKTHTESAPPLTAVSFTTSYQTPRRPQGPATPGDPLSGLRRPHCRRDGRAGFRQRGAGHSYAADRLRVHVGQRAPLFSRAKQSSPRKVWGELSARFTNYKRTDVNSVALRSPWLFTATRWGRPPPSSGPLPAAASSPFTTQTRPT